MHLKIFGRVLLEHESVIKCYWWVSFPIVNVMCVDFNSFRFTLHRLNQVHVSLKWFWIIDEATLVSLRDVYSVGESTCGSRYLYQLYGKADVNNFYNKTPNTLPCRSLEFIINLYTHLCLILCSNPGCQILSKTCVLYSTFYFSHLHLFFARPVFLLSGCMLFLNPNWYFRISWHSCEMAWFFLAIIFLGSLIKQAAHIVGDMIPSVLDPSQVLRPELFEQLSICREKLQF